MYTITKKSEINENRNKQKRKKNNNTIIDIFCISKYNNTKQIYNGRNISWNNTNDSNDNAIYNINNDISKSIKRNVWKCNERRIKGWRKKWT